MNTQQNKTTQKSIEKQKALVLRQYKRKRTQPCLPPIGDIPTANRFSELPIDIDGNNCQKT